jgi:hypothetical protein
MGASLIGSTASTTYTVTGLAPSTTYSFTVKAKDAAGNASVSSNTVNVTTLAGGGTVTYCSSSASNTADERIGNVKFGTINNTSTGTAGYENFTSVSTNVTEEVLTQFLSLRFGLLQNITKLMLFILIITETETLQTVES